MITNHYKWLFIGALFISFGFNPVNAVADDYLDAISDEANAPSPLHNDHKHSFHQLEKALQEKLPSTYKIFLKLTEHHQHLVVEVYMKDPNLTAVSKKVFDLYLMQNK